MTLKVRIVLFSTFNSKIGRFRSSLALLTTKLSCLQKNNFGHTKVVVAILYCSFSFYNLSIEQSTEGWVEFGNFSFPFSLSPLRGIHVQQLGFSKNILNSSPLRLDFFAKPNYCKRIVICNSNIGMKCPMKYLMCTTLFPVDYKNIFYAARSYGQPHSFLAGQKTRSSFPLD